MASPDGTPYPTRFGPEEFLRPDFVQSWSNEWSISEVASSDEPTNYAKRSEKDDTT